MWKKEGTSSPPPPPGGWNIKKENCGGEDPEKPIKPGDDVKPPLPDKITYTADLHSASVTDFLVQGGREPRTYFGPGLTLELDYVRREGYIIRTSHPVQIRDTLYTFSRTSEPRLLRNAIVFSADGPMPMAGIQQPPNPFRDSVVLVFNNKEIATEAGQRLRLALGV